MAAVVAGALADELSYHNMLHNIYVPPQPIHNLPSVLNESHDEPPSDTRIEPRFVRLRVAVAAALEQDGVHSAHGVGERSGHATSHSQVSFKVLQ